VSKDTAGEAFYVRLKTFMSFSLAEPDERIFIFVILSFAAQVTLKPKVFDKL
jgi:hypothetical protein